jgi:hypothetical protein
MIVIAFILSFWFALGIFVPRLRGRWAGTRVDCGPIGSFGFSLIFLSWGLRRMFHDSLSDRASALLVGASIVGWAIAILGFIFVQRRAKRVGGTMQDLQRHMITRV